MIRGRVSRWRELALWAAVALTLLPWSPFTRVANPGYVTPFIFVQTPLYLFTVAGMLVLGAWVCSRIRWLGVGALYVTVLAVLAPSDLALATAHWVTLGAAGIALLSCLSPAGRRWIVWALVVSTLAQIGYALLQYGHRDLLLFGLTPVAMIVPVGTLGNPKYLGAMIAMVAPLGPPWLLPFFILGIALSQSVLAAVALAAGLLVRYGLRRWWVWANAAFILAVAIWVHGPSTDSLWARLITWQLALNAWAWHGLWAWLFGSGFGTWFLDIPRLQVAIWTNPAEVFFSAHNEPLQLLYEGGLMGVGILVAWIVASGRSWARSPAFPGLVALAVLCGGLQVLHIPTLAPSALLVLGVCSEACSTSSDGAAF